MSDVPDKAKKAAVAIDPAILEAFAAASTAVSVAKSALLLEAVNRDQVAMPNANLLQEAVAIIPDEKIELAFAFFDQLGAASDKGSRLLFEFLADLTLPDVLAVMPRLKPAPKKKGRPKGSQYPQRRDEAHQALLKKNGVQPSYREILEETNRMMGKNPNQVEGTRTSILRAQRVAKNQ